MILCLVGRGTFYKKLIGACNDNVIGKLSPANYIYNWGMAGARFRQWEEEKARWIQGKPIFNRPIDNTKWTQLGKVEREGVPVLESTRDFTSLIPSPDRWLFKPDFSLGGRHIQLADQLPPPHVSGYYQRFIPGNMRKYELRVHASRFRPEEEYLVQKRVSDNPDAITWNHHTGGRFITVNRPRESRIFSEAQAYSRRVLDALNVDGGACDYMVTSEGEIFFLEINFSIGLRLEATLNFWIDTLNSITQMEGF